MRERKSNTSQSLLLIDVIVERLSSLSSSSSYLLPHTVRVWLWRKEECSKPQQKYHHHRYCNGHILPTMEVNGGPWNRVLVLVLVVAVVAGKPASVVLMWVHQYDFFVFLMIGDRWDPLNDLNNWVRGAARGDDCSYTTTSCCRTTIFPFFHPWGGGWITNHLTINT